MSDILPLPPIGRPGRAVIPRRQPDETLYEYLKRAAEAREEEIERLNRLVSLQNDLITDTDLHTQKTVHIILTAQAGFAVGPIALAFTWPGSLALDAVISLLIAGFLLVLAGLLLFHMLPRVGWMRDDLERHLP